MLEENTTCQNVWPTPNCRRAGGKSDRAGRRRPSTPQKAATRAESLRSPHFCAFAGSAAFASPQPPAFDGILPAASSSSRSVAVFAFHLYIHAHLLYNHLKIAFSDTVSLVARGSSTEEVERLRYLSPRSESLYGGFSFDRPLPCLFASRSQRIVQPLYFWAVCRRFHVWFSRRSPAYLTTTPRHGPRGVDRSARVPVHGCALLTCFWFLLSNTCTALRQTFAKRIRPADFIPAVAVFCLRCSRHLFASSLYIDDAGVYHRARFSWRYGRYLRLSAGGLPGDAVRRKNLAKWIFCFLVIIDVLR